MFFADLHQNTFSIQITDTYCENHLKNMQSLCEDKKGLLYVVTGNVYCSTTGV
jgi:hypothetical protein